MYWILQYNFWSGYCGIYDGDADEGYGEVVLLVIMNMWMCMAVVMVMMILVVEIMLFMAALLTTKVMEQLICREMSNQISFWPGSRKG